MDRWTKNIKRVDILNNLVYLRSLRDSEDWGDRVSKAATKTDNPSRNMLIKWP